MKPIWFVVLVTLLLLPASRLWAQPDLELYSAEVCNEGQITVDVAVQNIADATKKAMTE